MSIIRKGYGGKVVVNVLTALSVLGWTALSSANVSMKNGNFFIGYTDLFYRGGSDPKIERVYNSKTSFKGMFGEGWGNEFEVYLNVEADGSVRVHEYGGGAENIFSPSAFSEVELNKAVDTIASAAQKAGAVGTMGALEQYKRHLKSDLDFRNKEWEKLRAQGKIAARELQVGTKLNSNKFSYQFITRTRDGYTRAFDSGKVEYFDHNGRLLKVSDKNGNYVELSYNKEGHLAKLVDNFNRKMFFTFNEQGLVSVIEGENGKKAEYQYNGQRELVYSKDTEGNVYRYKYDSKGRHNMVEIAYSDKTTMQMSYYPLDKHENIKSVKDRDGTVTDYGYPDDPSDKGHVTVAVNVRGSDGKQISASKYEFFNKFKADGEEWTYKMIQAIDGDVTETTYNECCGLPLIIKHGGEETSFAYDTKGHVVKKITPTDVTELSYDSRVSKVSKVTRYSKLNKKQATWSVFKYDDKGNLVFAKNSENKGVQLFYDGNGRIKSLLDQSHRRIDFKYNEESKPVEISDPGLGSITVSYTNSGEIKKVESSAGRKIAMQVTTAFQNLLDIIRPAGVSLSF